MLTIIQVLEATIAARDPYTVAHQRRVAEIAQDIALEMGLIEKRLQALWLASIIHDLGKIAIPAEILTKPAKLKETEYCIIKEHPEVAVSILNPIKYFNQMSMVILQHHERMDGSGYPLGLKDKDILLEAKILGVADVFEAMTSHRPYRPSLGIEKAYDELRQNSGILYDAKVVEACLRIFRNRVHEDRVPLGFATYTSLAEIQNEYLRTPYASEISFGL
jgi:HD-GYP domain-containing protein (c-di-GMP phosphodiesterase class II)